MHDCHTLLLSFFLTDPTASAFDVLSGEFSSPLLDSDLSSGSFFAFSFSFARLDFHGSRSEHLCGGCFNGYQLTRPKFTQKVVEFMAAMTHVVLSLIDLIFC